jgi:hypothetical protein
MQSSANSVNRSGVIFVVARRGKDNKKRKNVGVRANSLIDFF